MTRSNAVLHVAASHHPVAAEAVAEVAVQLLDSIGFAPPPAVLHLAICGTHALHAEAIVAATGELIRPQLLTAELHAPESELAVPRTDSGILRALAIAPGAATVGPGSPDRSPHGATRPEHTPAGLDPDRPTVQFSGAAGPTDADPIAMHWNADRLLCWSDTTGVRHLPTLDIQLDPQRLAWLCGPSVDQLPLDSMAWSRPLLAEWHGDTISLLDHRPATELMTESIDSLLRLREAARLEELAEWLDVDDPEAPGPGQGSFDEIDDASELGVWVVWPEQDMPAPLDRLTALARVDSVHHLSGAVRVRPIPAIDRAAPVQLLAVSCPKSHPMAKAGGPAFVVRTRETDPVGLEDAASMPWPVSNLFVSTGGGIPVPIAGALWCLAPDDGSRLALLTE